MLFLCYSTVISNDLTIYKRTGKKIVVTAHYLQNDILKNSLKTGAAATTTAVGGAMKAAAQNKLPNGGATITGKGSNVTGPNGPGGGNWESKFNNWSKFLKAFGRYIDTMNSQDTGAKSSFIKPVVNQP